MIPTLTMRFDVNPVINKLRLISNMVDGIAAYAVEDACTMVMNESTSICPEDTGLLVSTADVSVDIQGKMITGYMSYGGPGGSIAPYGPYVHEKPGQRFTKPTAQWHFLMGPLLANTGVMMEIFREDLDGFATLNRPPKGLQIWRGHATGFGPRRKGHVGLGTYKQDIGADAGSRTIKANLKEK